jgi:hypothetical protein
MITIKGKSILAKYLLGQTPAYASYIALGCGPKPLDTTADFADYSESFSAKADLDFEMFRVPVISKGYVTEDGVSKIVLTAELPTEERYEISEIGIYSSGTNPTAADTSSKILLTFSDNEIWEYHSGIVSEDIPKKTLASELVDSSNNIVYAGKAFRLDADSSILSTSTRLARYERPRFLNNNIVVRGDTSSLYTDSGDGYLEFGLGDHIHLTNISLNLDASAPTDELRLAFSLISKNDVSPATISNVKVMIEFASNHTEESEWARFNVDIDAGTGSGQQDFSANRYVVAKQQLQQMQKTANFSWSEVTTAKIYVTINDYSATADDTYVALDALRLESIAATDANPLYGLTGYTIIKDQNMQPVLKEANTSNFVEFRFALDVA